MFIIWGILIMNTKGKVKQKFSISILFFTAFKNVVHENIHFKLDQFSFAYLIVKAKC